MRHNLSISTGECDTQRLSHAIAAIPPPCRNSGCDTHGVSQDTGATYQGCRKLTPRYTCCAVSGIKTACLGTQNGQYRHENCHFWQEERPNWHCFYRLYFDIKTIQINNLSEFSVTDWLPLVQLLPLTEN
ncbi:conserved hypothetical protein [Stutzerimonas stutzeri A1501]|uniref:Uncharacterized protein n=1 Tax=Stutzerimonas stutzeri (strain A1501) TaxID=379731 RepID=A4VH55_STUS1|nr:conserved hypothetical protein [Stutzerimonas stutzeri A1501]